MKRLSDLDVIARLQYSRGREENVLSVTAVPRRSLARGNQGSPGGAYPSPPGLSRPATAEERPDTDEEGSHA